MSNFIFSADGHIAEPSNLFVEGLPPSVRDGYRFMMAGSKVLSKMNINKPPPVQDPNVEQFGRGNRLGIKEIPGRLIDMESEGIDAEIVFPSQGLFVTLIENPEAELASCQLYNDWNAKFFS